MRQYSPLPDRPLQSGTRFHRPAQALPPTVVLEDPAVSAILREPHAWVFGNEAWGLPPAVAEAADLRVSIPMAGRAESLNLSTAAAICLYASSRAG